MENLELWNKLKEVPASAQKKIVGGRLQGMTDIKPQWRYEKLTEVFGPCSVGWKFEIKKLWLEEGADGQQTANAEVWLYVIHLDIEPAVWSAPIAGIGGSMFIAKEKRGMHTSDEAYKMAVTDALGTAAKMLGLAADVYMGNKAGASKYSGKRPEKEDPNPSTGPSVENPDDKITAGQLKKLNAILTEQGLNEKDSPQKAAVRQVLKTASLKDLKRVTVKWLFETDKGGGLINWGPFVDRVNEKLRTDIPFPYKGA